MTSLGVITCTETNGTLFGSMATQSASSIAITGGSIAGATLGGVTMGIGLDATGDIYLNNGGVLTRLGIGSTSQVLEVVGGKPSWATVAGITAVVTVKKQIFTSSETYTPSTGMIYAMIECQGSGGAGGGVTGSASDFFSAGGGGAGSYSRILVTAATVGASQTVTVGAGGTAGSAGSNPETRAPTSRSALSA